MKRLEGVLSVISGIIIPVEWSEEGDITGIALSTYDEEEYLITNHEKIEELIGFLRQEVEVTGNISAFDKKKSVFVLNFVPKYNSGLKN